MAIFDWCRFRTTRCLLMFAIGEFATETRIFTLIFPMHDHSKEFSRMIWADLYSRPMNIVELSKAMISMEWYICISTLLSTHSISWAGFTFKNILCKIVMDKSTPQMWAGLRICGTSCRNQLSHCYCLSAVAVEVSQDFGTPFESCMEWFARSGFHIDSYIRKTTHWQRYSDEFCWLCDCFQLTVTVGQELRITRW